MNIINYPDDNCEDGIAGAGLKIPMDLYERNPQIVQMFLSHMDKYLVKNYPWILGFDETYIENTEGKHYHLHFFIKFTCSLKTVMNYKNTFSVKDRKMKFYICDAPRTHFYRWLAYATKENIVQNLPYNYNNKEGYQIGMVYLEVYRKFALEKKKQKFELDKKHLEEKDLKKDLYNSLVEYFEKNCFRTLQVHHDDANPQHFRMLCIKYYKDELDSCPRRQDLIIWQNKYFSKKWTLEEMDNLIMGRL